MSLVRFARYAVSKSSQTLALVASSSSITTSGFMGNGVPPSGLNKIVNFPAVSPAVPKMGFASSAEPNKNETPVQLHQARIGGSV